MEHNFNIFSIFILPDSFIVIIKKRAKKNNSSETN